MGCGSFKSEDWSDYKSKKGISDSSSARDIYKSTSVKSELEPNGVALRESCDSLEHPESTPVILGLDVTGSMACVIENIFKKMGVLITGVYDRKPILDPQIMVMAFGDTTCDSHPLQVTQFEADIRIVEQLNDIYFEQGGGGNDGESYILPWYFASRHTKTDSFDKRGKKGFLFTFGDEKYLSTLSKEDVKKFIGDDIQADLTAEELLSEVSRQYNIYHLMIEEGSGMKYSHGTDVIDQWRKLLGQNAILVSDCEKIPEIIISILEINAGKKAEDVIASWDGSTSIAVSKAVGGLSVTDTGTDLVEM